MGANVKIGRNDPCPCKSGKKYKKCCLGKDSETVDVSLQFARLQAHRQQIEKQQGRGKTIISIEHKEYRLVFVGSRMYYSKKWKTVHDFLLEHLKIVFGKEWGEQEFKKSFDEQHPILQWYKLAFEYMKEHQDGAGKISSAPMTGAVSAYLNLSYNLYLLAHNAGVKDRLIQRLKNKADFQGALYETYVAGLFILAGFKLELENEDDPTKSHCEFTAISQKTGEKYSIEAKARQPFKEDLGIGDKLYKALKKDAEFKRVVFIDMNVPDLIAKKDAIVKELNEKELTLTINKLPAPPAYIFVTNHSFVYDLTGYNFERTGFGHGFKIADFKIDTIFSNLRDALTAREKHKDMDSLIDSIREHTEIPVTFNGEIPEFAFSEENRKNRLLIGNKYIVPDKQGNNVEAVLVNATVAENEKKIYGVYQLAGGNQIICTNPMTEDELLAYKIYPDTFFGVPLTQGKKVNYPLELYDFFYENHKNTPRDKLLEFMKNRSDLENLKNQSDKELLITYCEGLVYASLNVK